MKKTPWLSLALVLLIAVVSCGPSHIVRIHPKPDYTPVDLTKYQLDNETAEAMIKCFRSRFVVLRKKPEMFTTIPSVHEQIYTTYYSQPNTVIDTVYARYKGDIGKNFYCTNVNDSKVPGVCGVNWYTTIITSVTTTTTVDKLVTTSVKYFSYTKICPPPTNGCNR